MFFWGKNVLSVKYLGEVNRSEGMLRMRAAGGLTEHQQSRAAAAIVTHLLDCSYFALVRLPS